MKHLCFISFNTVSKQKQDYTYNFGNTKNVKISISKNAFSITAKMTKIYDKEEMLSGGTYLFSDAIKKAMLLHILKYSENLLIKTITFRIDDEEETLDFRKIPVVYSLVEGKLERKLPKEWNAGGVSDFVLSQTKSSFDMRTSSLYAYICSKTKRYEAERFIYLWMAFNGMYGYFARMISEAYNLPIKKENRQIRYLQKLYDLGDEAIGSEDEKRAVAQKVASLIVHSTEITSKENLESENGRDFCEKVKGALKKEDGSFYNLTAYGYLLTQFSYYYRCSIIHANRPVSLFSFTNEADIVCLRTINNLLEEFIEENLPKWLDKEYVENYLKPKAADIKIIK